MGNWCKIFLTRNDFKDFENIVGIWLLKYLIKLLGSKLFIWIHLTCELLMWVCPCVMMLVITPSLWRVITSSSWWQAKLEALTLHDTGKSLVCGWGYCPYGQKTTCKRGTMWHIIPCYLWGEEVNPWMWGWG